MREKWLSNKSDTIASPPVLVCLGRPSGLNNTSLFSQICDWKSRIKMPAGLTSPEISILGLQPAVLSLCPLTDVPLCTQIPGVSSSSHKDTCISFSLSYLFKGPVSKQPHWGLGLQLRNWGWTVPEHMLILWCKKYFKQGVSVRIECRKYAPP